MSERNMWIGQKVREQEEPAVPQVDEELLQDAVDIELEATTPLSRSELSLDELVPRTWRKW